MSQGSEEEVALIVLKRPPVTEKKIEEIEVLIFATCLTCHHMEGLQMTEEDEVSVCAEGEGWMAGAKEQWGFVKVPFFVQSKNYPCFEVKFCLHFIPQEYIETEGLATILSKVKESNV